MKTKQKKTEENLNFSLNFREVFANGRDYQRCPSRNEGAVASDPHSHLQPEARQQAEKKTLDDKEWVGLGRVWQSENWATTH